jgi:hypothetical protein
VGYSDPVARALHIFEHAVVVCDSTIYYVLRKLLRGPLPVIKGKSKTFVEGPVDTGRSGHRECSTSSRAFAGQP